MGFKPGLGAKKAGKTAGISAINRCNGWRKNPPVLIFHWVTRGACFSFN